MKIYDRISLGILAGGRASRLNGANKAFLRYQNDTLIQRILDRLEARFADRLISAREDDIRFQQMALLPVLDKREPFSGPLAGIEAMLEAATGEFLLTIPVDIKYVPSELLLSWLDQPEYPGMVLHDMNGLQPLLALWHVDSARIAVSDALDKQESSVHSVISSLNFSIIHRTDFQIGNLNTPRDFEAP